MIRRVPRLEGSWWLAGTPAGIARHEMRRLMEHNLEHTISLLTRTPAVLDALLRDLPEAWTFRNEGEHTWSAFEVVGHLIHAERTDWMPRARLVLQVGETQPFQSFDRGGHLRESHGQSLGQLLDEFARARSETMGEHRGLHLRQAELERRTPASDISTSAARPPHGDPNS